MGCQRIRAEVLGDGLRRGARRVVCSERPPVGYPTTRNLACSRLVDCA